MTAAVPDSPSHATIAIIGAGVAGREFASRCASAGFTVVLEDVMPAKLRRAEEQFSSLGHAVALVATVEDAVRDASLVIDFVPDELESKLEIWSLIDRMAPPKTILCTPSAVLSISDLASCTYRPDRCVMVRGDLLLDARLKILTAHTSSSATQRFTERVFGSLGYGVETEHDPDLPMLLKNMNARVL